MYVSRSVVFSVSSSNVCSFITFFSFLGCFLKVIVVESWQTGVGRAKWSSSRKWFCRCGWYVQTTCIISYNCCRMFHALCSLLTWDELSCLQQRMIVKAWNSQHHVNLNAFFAYCSQSGTRCMYVLWSLKRLKLSQMYCESEKDILRTVWQKMKIQRACVIPFGNAWLVFIQGTKLFAETPACCP